MKASFPIIKRHGIGLRQRAPVWLVQALWVGLAGVLFAAPAGAQTAGADQPPKAVATLDGQPLYEEQLPAIVRSQLQTLRQQESALESMGLDALLEQKLLEAQAKERGMTLAQLAAEVDSKVPDPTASEMNAYYLSQKDQYGKPLDQVRDQIRDALKKVKIQQARQSYAKDLLAQAKARGAVVAFIGPKRVQVAVDPTRLKGSASAPVMIVEFADFSCPFCREAATTMKTLLSEYQGKVSLAYRDYPLSAIHPHAELAAEASRCAAEQGRFWEYHDVLFANPEKQDRKNLLLDARVLKLDEKQFESCLSGAKYKAQVDEDLQAANRAGVTATPGFFVNGIFVDGAQPAAIFEQIINGELAPADRKIVQQ